ncbi:MAG: glutaconate CoA-transferase, partial [Peptococcaceae bacterium]|nr:glutaconate CoA-transferase [Peptococcaceae bacterium]
KGVFRFHPETREMYLHTIYPGVEVGEIKESVGWDLKVAGDLKLAPEPAADELAALKAADPCNLIMGGAEARKKLSGLDEFVELTLKYVKK